LAQNNTVEEKIYSLIIHTLYPAKVKVYADTPQKKEILKNISKIELVEAPDLADFLLLEHKLRKPVQGVIFTTSYHLLQTYKNQAIGGFFWQKGRPNILFLKQNLQKHHIKLPPSMQEYVEESL
jgi:hypothetical protein